MNKSLTVGALLCSLLFVRHAGAADAAPSPCEWPRWRGPAGDGHAAPGDYPVKWDAGDVVWKTPLKGKGQSSPVVCGDRIFLTSALESGKKRLVFCVDHKTGKILWEQVAWTGDPERSVE